MKLPIAGPLLSLLVTTAAAGAFFLTETAPLPPIPTAITSADVAAVHLVRVIDGDTYVVRFSDGRQQTVRVRHLDTPEKAPRAKCAEEAQLALQATKMAQDLMPSNVPLRLTEVSEGADKYGRTLATVYLADNTDVATALIRAGLGRRYEGGKKSMWCR